jgi:CrcB protein
MLRSYVLVALGSALGGVARVALSGGIYRRWGTSWPWGTLAVNLVGCFLIGVLFGWAEVRFRLSPGTRLFLMAGFCGGFTTFSTFALESSQLLKSGAPLAALVYAMSSVVLGVTLFWTGTLVGR